MIIYVMGRESYVGYFVKALKKEFEGEGYTIVRGDHLRDRVERDEETIRGAALRIIISLDPKVWERSVPADLYPVTLVMDPLHKDAATYREKALEMGFLDVVKFTHDIATDVASVRQALQTLAQREEEE